MSGHRVFNILAVVALIVVAALTVRLAAATKEITSSSAEAASALDSSQGPADQASAGSVRSLGPTLDECFDVSFGEMAACHADVRASSQNLAESTPPFHGKLAECFDVPLSETCDL